MKTVKCPPGYILRKGYTRTFRNSITKQGYTVRRKGRLYTVRPRKTSVTVKPKCIVDRGLPGKGPSEGHDSMAPLRKGDLVKYGYQYRLSDTLRERALKKAVKAYGVRKVYHKLDAVVKLSERTAPDASKIFRRDRQWVHDNFSMAE